MLFEDEITFSYRQLHCSCRRQGNQFRKSLLHLRLVLMAPLSPPTQRLLLKHQACDLCSRSTCIYSPCLVPFRANHGDHPTDWKGKSSQATIWHTCCTYLNLWGTINPPEKKKKHLGFSYITETSMTSEIPGDNSVSTYFLKKSKELFVVWQPQYCTFIFQNTIFWLERSKQLNLYIRLTRFSCQFSCEGLQHPLKLLSK